MLEMPDNLDKAPLRRSDVWWLSRWIVSKVRGDGEYRIVRFVTAVPPPFDFSDLEDDDD